jgi:hypothetical protein
VVCTLSMAENRSSDHLPFRGMLNVRPNHNKTAKYGIGESPRMQATNKTSSMWNVVRLTIADLSCDWSTSSLAKVRSWLDNGLMHGFWTALDTYQSSRRKVAAAVSRMVRRGSEEQFEHAGSTKAATKRPRILAAHGYPRKTEEVESFEF